VRPVACLTPFALLALLLAGAPAGAAAQPTGSISGSVSEASAPHAGIEGIQVCAISTVEEVEEEGGEGPPSPPSCANTEAHGEYTITGLASGNYYVGFGVQLLSTLDWVPEYYEGRYTLEGAKQVTVAAPGAVTGVDAQLEEGGEIEGTVTSAADGAPIAGVLVCAIETTGQGSCAETGEAGQYEIRGLATGVYRVGFDGRGFAVQYYGGGSTAGTGTTVEVTAKKLTPGIDAALRARSPDMPKGLLPRSPGSSGSQSPEGPSSSATTGPMPSPPPAVSLSATDESVLADGVALVGLRCAKAAPSSCSGRVTLLARRLVVRGHRRVHERVSIGAASFSIRPGAAERVPVRLGDFGRTLLGEDHGLLTAAARVTQDKPIPAQLEHTVSLQSASQGGAAGAPWLVAPR